MSQETMGLLLAITGLMVLVLGVALRSGGWGPRRLVWLTRRPLALYPSLGDYWRGLVRKRTLAARENQIPMLIEYLILGGQAGMNLQQSLQLAAASLPHPLKDDVEGILGLLAVGHSLETALRETRLRLDGRLASLLEQLEKAQTLGVSLERTLAREHRYSLRRQSHRLGEQVNTLSLKVTALALLFLFPPLVLLVVVPSLLAFITTW